MPSARWDLVRLAKRAGALLITIAVILAAGCSAPGRLRLVAAGPRAYWDRARRLGARPFLPHGRLVPRPGQSASSHPAGLALRVGALFVREGSSDHFCTASVVDSPGRDLLITAAHCLNGGRGGGRYRQDIAFIPVRVRRVHRRHQRQPVGHPFRLAHPDRHDRRRDRRLPARRGHRVGVVQRLPEPGRAAPLPAGRRRHPLTSSVISPGRVPG